MAFCYNWSRLEREHSTNKTKNQNKRKEKNTRKINKKKTRTRERKQNSDMTKCSLQLLVFSMGSSWGVTLGFCHVWLWGRWGGVRLGVVGGWGGSEGVGVGESGVGGGRRFGEGRGLEWSTTIQPHTH